MKRIFSSRFTNAIACAITGCLIGGSTQLFADGKPSTKARKKVELVVRAQNTGSPTPARTANVTDEEIFDRDLTPASSQIGCAPNAPCVTPMPPNCTDINGNPLLPMSPAPIPGVGPESSPSPAPDPSTLLNSPSTNPQSQAGSQPSTPQSNPFQSGGGGEGLGMTSTSASVAPFMGDFFGGSLFGRSAGAATIGTVVQTGPGTFASLNTNGGVPLQFQTTKPFMVNSPNPFGNGQFSLPNHGSGLTLVPIGQQIVQFNPPPPTNPSGPFIPPNPQSVQVFDVRTNLNTGGIDPAVITGRTKLAEGSSPIPRDRVFFNYSYFDNVNLSSSGVNVNRYTPGFEKTFLNGNASVEVRVPFASTLSSNIDTVTGVANPTDMQFGNLTLYTKALLYQTQTVAYSTGLGFTLPTANNVNIYSGDTQLLHVKNDAVHLLPFVGGTFTPNDRFYTQGLLQFDLDANGNRVDSFTNADGFVTSTSRQVGIFRDASYLYASVSAGYWIYRSETPGPFGMTGFSPFAELHYNRSLQGGNQVSQTINNVSTQIYGESFSNVEVLNAVVGSNMIFGRNRILSLGYTTPLGMGVDKQFAGEFRVMFNWYFGSGNSSPLTRVGRAQF